MLTNMTAAPLALAAAMTLCACSSTIDATETSSVHAYPKAKGLERLVEKNAHLLDAAYSQQTGSVQTECFPVSLKKVLAGIGSKYGVKPVVTSGNRPRAGRSMHARCLAADIRVPGVAPSKIAAYARSMKGIGGVGTYCRNGIVHVDVGPRRDWRHC